MSGVKRKLSERAETDDKVTKDPPNNNTEDPPSAVKKIRTNTSPNPGKASDQDAVKRNQEVAYKIAMELLQQLQPNDGTLSSDLIGAVEDIMAHTQSVVAFAKRHAPTPFPPTLGLFCIFSTEVLLYLFSYLSPKELWTVRAVCHVFEGISRDQSLWKTLCLRHFPPIHNQLHNQLGKNWEWLYRCKSRLFKSKTEITDGTIGRFIDQSQGLNERYEGEWGIATQKGTFFNSAKSTCVLNGYGMFIDEGNNVFEGNFRLGKLNGTGRQYANLSNMEFEYNGEFKEGLWHGTGTCVYADGRKYYGRWEDGQRHGVGTMTYPDQRKFVGEWRQGLRHGKGILTWPSGARYEGTWALDEMKGGGNFFANDGTLAFSPPTLEEAFTILWQQQKKSSASKI